MRDLLSCAVCGIDPSSCLPRSNHEIEQQADAQASIFQSYQSRLKVRAAPCQSLEHSMKLPRYSNTELSASACLCVTLKMKQRPLRRTPSACACARVTFCVVHAAWPRARATCRNRVRQAAYISNHFRSKGIS